MSTPYKHQEVGINLLVEHEYFGLLDEMGAGKSLQVVHAACRLQQQGKINTVLVVCPASVRSVWTGAEFGEVKKHSYLPSSVYEFHNPSKLVWKDQGDSKLVWFVTNYEYLRMVKRQKELMQLLKGKNVLMVCDESSFIKSKGAIQTKACTKIGEEVSRRVILNGTPISNNPLDLWSQIRFLSKDILPYVNYYSFRDEFANITTKHGFPLILGWKNLDLLQKHIAPYVIRREKKDCLDLPEKIYTTREVPLTEDTWEIYKQMRDEAVVWMNENPSMAAQAGVKVMRLAQITGGFLGGFNNGVGVAEPEMWDPEVPKSESEMWEPNVPKEIGREKLNTLREYINELLVDKPGLKIIVWGRFRAELERVYTELADVIPTYLLYGGQTKTDRTASIERFSDVNDKRSGLLAAQVQAGGFGLNLVAADHVVYLSNDFSFMTRQQSEDRCHRPGQRNNVIYLDVLATGPNGEKTIDHHVVKSLRSKGDLANFTVSAWKKALED